MFSYLSNDYGYFFLKCPTVATHSLLQSKCFVAVKMSDFFDEAFRISNGENDIKN